MLSSSAIVEAVTRKLKAYTPPAIVVDPVMISKSKFPLLKEESIDSLKTELIPLATVITPNIYEAELLAQQEIRDTDAAKHAAKVIAELGCHAVLVKGGHLTGNSATDVLYWRRGMVFF